MNKFSIFTTVVLLEDLDIIIIYYYPFHHKINVIFLSGIIVHKQQDSILIWEKIYEFIRIRFKVFVLIYIAIQ